ncbi:uncharacterized protein LOC141897780 isoform X2 [Acropora palmata]|uniref:uncharacterized protein LOC141897780 isoform X2 n=1 Tax=Acropora palmata TaxID=6131 RepID=UPI003DA122FF
MQEITRKEQENERLLRELDVKEEELKKVTKETNQTYDDQKKMRLEMEVKKEELRKLEEQNKEWANKLSALKAEMQLKDKSVQNQEKERQERAVEELKVQLSKAIQEKEELKASVDELNTKLQAELSTKEYFERALIEAKNTLASNKEKLANLEEENKQLERNLLEAQEQLEKGKEKSDALDKEHKELQEMGQTLKRKEQFQNDLYDTVRKIQENLTELERQGQEKKIEFMTLKEKVKRNFVKWPGRIITYFMTFLLPAKKKYMIMIHITNNNSYCYCSPKIILICFDINRPLFFLSSLDER